MKQKPLISVLVPAFNAEITLAETLGSALASSYANLEIIVVDDGSSDRTAAVAEEFARADPRVRLIREQHRGVSAALNRGLAEVRGEFVARLDADDLWHPTKLEKQLARMQADPAVALVYTFVRIIDSDGRVLRDGPRQQLEGQALCQCLYEGIFGGGSSVLFRKSALDQAGGFEESLRVWEDLLIHLHVTATGTIASVPEYLVGYRSRAGSSSANLQSALRNWRVARRLIRRQLPQIPAFVHRWSDARRLLELGLASAAEGSPAAGARLISRSLLLDFERTSRLLRVYFSRSFRGVRSIHEAGARFETHDPTEPRKAHGPGAAIEAPVIEALERRRSALLASAV